jgi:hypothetical protein
MGINEIAGKMISAPSKLCTQNWITQSIYGVVFNIWPNQGYRNL